MLDVNRLDDKSYVGNYIRKSLEEVLKWTTLKCDWRNVDIEIPYNLVLSSAKQPWGYRYRLYDIPKGTMTLVNIAEPQGLEEVLISLISNFCTTRWGNLVDGRATLYHFVPQAKKAYNRS